jgi:hypothetical protein
MNHDDRRIILRGRVSQQEVSKCLDFLFFCLIYLLYFVECKIQLRKIRNAEIRILEELVHNKFKNFQGG